jgi:hypothetical protein
MQVSQNQITRSYNQEDIQQILHLAIACQAYEGEFSYEQLVEIAAELEISPENLHVAEQQWLERQGERQKRQAFDVYRWGRFKKHAGNYAIANSFLVLLNLLNSHELSWSLYILLFWGLGLGLNAWNTIQSDGEEYERAFQRWYLRHQIKQSVNTFFNNLLKGWPI